MARSRADDYDDKRAAILAAAAVLFAEHGYDGTSMSRIADSLGVSKALVYHYYTAKEELLFDIIEAHLQRLTGAVENAGNGKSDDPETRLTRLTAALLSAYRDADAEHKVQINDLKRLSPDRQEILKAMERRLVSIFSDAIAAANPALANGNPLLKPVTMSLFGMINWQFLWFRPDGPIGRDAYAELVTRLIVDGSAHLKRETGHR